jgi:hypothetical protein
MKIIVKNFEEIKEQIIGEKLIEFEILKYDKNKKEGRDVDYEEPHCCKDKEILMNFSNGKEMRIYVDEKGNLCVYTD